MASVLSFPYVSEDGSDFHLVCSCGWSGESGLIPDGEEFECPGCGCLYRASWNGIHLTIEYDESMWQHAE